ncbi:hypothetical protein DICPUDRAFT_147264 [Dictyostelium purpureum]|uniref:Uncharacterized protein n=1 Tax=Dictyostelium purpureum TaxID=5786 RepID=F0Z826_DICPU|nr:uncharacterized protein DICPUDRAFT_147264 [Dictyostelium purpureum]EGC39947.1 hypothetical protein DICPUDRAFT_147264 [Dictyostelium purpureum]|eukprot:XP_003283576.1 hypothetical protein DICPUDRAFT_147264 [Dictyostelium purpureum]
MTVVLKNNVLYRPGSISTHVTSDSTTYLGNFEEREEAGSWKFLPLYTFVVVSGEWKHRSKLTKMFERRWLSRTNYNQSGKLSFNSKRKQLDLGNVIPIRIKRSLSK